MLKFKVLAFMVLLLSPLSNSALAQEQGFQEVWSIDSVVFDLDVSGDGSRVVMVNYTGVYCYSAEHQEILWQVLPPAEDNVFLLQVVTSWDGGGTAVLFEEEVEEDAFAAGIAYIDGEGNLLWMHYFPGRCIIPREGKLIDISDDGEIVVAALNDYTHTNSAEVTGETNGGYNSSLLYIKDSLSRSGEYYGFTDATWYFGFDTSYSSYMISCLDMSADGALVAAGFTYKYLFFWPNALNASGLYPAASGLSHLTAPVLDVGVSGDGYAAAAVTPGTDDYGPETLYYWSDVPSLGEESPANWTRQHGFQCVDLNWSGDSVVAGTGDLGPCGVHYWSGALSVDGVNDHHEEWTRHEGETIFDVAVSREGDVIAASAIVPDEGCFVYFFDGQGNSLGEFQVGYGDLLLEMSGNGRVVAVGGGRAGSLHVYMLPDLVEPVGGVLAPVGLTPLYLGAALVLAASIALGTRNSQHLRV